MNGQQDRDQQQEIAGALNQFEGAGAKVVNRTHRIVRDQALAMRERREKFRSLWVPLAICSVLMLGICYAIWSMLDGYDVSPNGVPDASDQLSLLLVWSLPVTALVLGLVWFKRGRGRSGYNGEAQS
jgi:hypothetical protein